MRWQEGSRGRYCAPRDTMPASMGHSQRNTIGHPLHRPQGSLLHGDSANFHRSALQKPSIHAGDGHPWRSIAGHCNASCSGWKRMCDRGPLGTPPKSPPWHDDKHIFYHPWPPRSVPHHKRHAPRRPSGGHTVQSLHDQLVEELSQLPRASVFHPLVRWWGPGPGLHCSWPHASWRFYRCNLRGRLCHACPCSHQPTHWGGH